MDQAEDSNTLTRDDARSLDQQSSSNKIIPRRRARKPRKCLSCDPCRHSKLRCDRQRPCGTCRQRGCDSSCTFSRGNDPSTPGEEHTPRPPKQPQLTSAADGTTILPRLVPSVRNINEGPATSQGPFSGTPGSPSADSRWDDVLRRPHVGRNDTPSALENLFVPSSVLSASSKEDLLRQLPPDSLCEYLISEYFTHLSPLFHILHGPTFERQYSAFLQDRGTTTFSWLALLFIICSVTLNTLEPGNPVLVNQSTAQPQQGDLIAMVHQLRKSSLTCLAEDRFLVHHDLNTLETILILTYSVSHNEGVERGWILLGMALNMGIALRCNANSAGLSCIDTERRRRCWAGILMLHTYQAILFRDIDISFLLNIKATLPTNANDSDIHEHIILQTTSQPTQMSLMNFKLRLFRLSAEVCSHISGPAKLDQHTLKYFDTAIAEERRLWDSVFLVNGLPRVLDHASYAHWYILQTYAHQLYLLLHRPFHNPQSPSFLPSSRDRCIESSSGLLAIHREFCELPKLQHFKWLVNGMTSLNALHGAVALASCLLSMPATFNSTPYWDELNATVSRMKTLQHRSPVCAKAFPVLQHLQ
ncbi:hypothetical protein PENPOL_c036G02457 [Penicillium polonicum]|uniref:Zn(2)-C6 fungal-type domain-containing protein n=1 Tax=Penicillium polonicum TaxID=60169 RepID=A0A1V6N5S6_PENPO|nr:hypothetical protein PENPOL_c036G02457 [Penicillium polonicum]